MKVIKNSASNDFTDLKNEINIWEFQFLIFNMKSKRSRPQKIPDGYSKAGVLQIIRNLNGTKLMHTQITHHAPTMHPLKPIF